MKLTAADKKLLSEVFDDYDANHKWTAPGASMVCGPPSSTRWSRKIREKARKLIAKLEGRRYKPFPPRRRARPPPPHRLARHRRLLPGAGDPHRAVLHREEAGYVQNLQAPQVGRGQEDRLSRPALPHQTRQGGSP